MRFEGHFTKKTNVLLFRLRALQQDPVLPFQPASCSVQSDDLSWNANATAIISKAHQRLRFLRQLKGFGLRRDLLIGFYRCRIESVLTFSICLWFGGMSAQQRRRLDRVVKPRTGASAVGCLLWSQYSGIAASSVLERSSLTFGTQLTTSGGVATGKRFSLHRSQDGSVEECYMYPAAVAALNNDVNFLVSCKVLVSQFSFSCHVCLFWCNTKTHINGACQSID